MELQWNEHTVEVRGDWTARWFFLAPEYELCVDGECIDRVGGPNLRPTMEGIIDTGDEDDGADPHIQAEVMSLFGFRPRCTVTVDGEQLGSDRIQVANVLNPFLVLVILAAAGVMLYVGPEVLQEHLPFV